METNPTAVVPWKSLIACACLSIKVERGDWEFLEMRAASLGRNSIPLPLSPYNELNLSSSPHRILPRTIRYNPSKMDIDMDGAVSITGPTGTAMNGAT